MATRPVRRARMLRMECLESRLALSTFHVAPGGSDANNGSAAAPWATLQKAAQMVGPGDTVSVAAGNYAGFDLWTSGTASQPIVFDADPGAVINARNPRTPDGINLEGASYVTIEGFKVVGMPRTGIRSVLNEHVTIRNNVLDLNATWGILTGWSDDLLIENNVASRSQTQHGIYVSNSGDRPIIRNNVSFANAGCGIHMNGDINMGGDGIISGAIVENNTIYDNGRAGGAAINADGVQNSRFQNNLLFNNHATGIALFRQDGGGGSSNNTVVNNTIVNASDSRYALYLHDGSIGNTLQNNIFYNQHPSRGSFDVGSDSLSGLNSDYNVVMDRILLDDAFPQLTLAQWQSATGLDRHSLVATPAQLFVNAPAGDYHLSLISPALNAGSPTFAPPRDLEGVVRPQGSGIDIGAYERANAIVNLPPIALADSIGTAAGTPIDVNVLANDSDPEGQPLAVASFTAPSNGSLVKLANGQLRYTPQAGFSGVDTFTYQASDGALTSTPATVTVTVSSPAATTVIVDNRSPGFNATSKWIAYPGQGYLNEVHYAWAGAGDQAQWTAAVPTGQYQVAVTWSPLYNRATNSPFSVRDGSIVRGTTTINQQLAPVGFADQGVVWQSLGVFTVTSGNLAVVTSDLANGAVIADAVRFQRVGNVPTNPPPAAPQIIDNLDPGFSTAANWISYPGQGYHDNVHYAWPNTGGGAQWTTNVAPGRYQVSITWSPYYNRATNAAFTVRDGAASLGTSLVNQQLAPVGLSDQGSTWQSLGEFNIASGSLAVLASDIANGAVIADAIRLQRIGDLTDNPPASAVQIIDNGDVGFRTSGEWIAYPGQGYQNDVHYAAAGPGPSVAEWTAALTPGRYRVAVTWSPEYNRATDAPFTVRDGAVSLGTTLVNQVAAPADFVDAGVAWKSLGTFDIGGGGLTVSLGLGNKYVIADAVRIERIDNLFASPAELDDVLTGALLDPLLT